MYVSLHAFTVGMNERQSAFVSLSKICIIIQLNRGVCVADVFDVYKSVNDTKSNP